jgi:AraC family transcriptional activator of pobA
MDRRRNCLHYPNMESVPTYALYGEAVSDRQQDWLQVLSLTGGRGEVTLDGAAFDLTPSAIVVVPALTVHGYVFSEDVEGVIVTLMARDMAEGVEDLPAAVIVTGTNPVHRVLDGLLAEADRPGDQHDLAMRAHITLLKVALHRARSLPAFSDAGDGRARLHVGAFRQLVDQKFRETRRIGDYAEALGISQTHLSRVCRQVLGASALSVIEQRIALEARRQLLFSTLSIKQIGAGLGYDDPAYFTRMLKRVLGVPPLAFRRQSGR